MHTHGKYANLTRWQMLEALGRLLVEGGVLDLTPTRLAVSTEIITFCATAQAMTLDTDTYLHYP